MPTTDPTTDPATDADRYRLPRTARPRHYDLTIEPDLAAATFSGRAAVAIEVLTETSTIVVNAAELEVSGVHLVRADGTRIDADATTCLLYTSRCV